MNRYLANLIKRIFKISVYEARALIWDITGKLRKSVTIKTKQGIFTVFCSDTIIGRSLFCQGEYEYELTLKVIELLDREKIPYNRKGTIVDIGANIGIISIGMVNNNLFEKAIAFEPEPRNFSILQSNIKQNKLEKLFICEPYALSDTKGQVQFELSDTNYGDHRVRRSLILEKDFPDLFNEYKRKVIKVESDSLDQLLKIIPKNFTDEISMIWIDIQGYEGYAFKGGKNIFSKNIPTVTEIWPYGIERAGMSQSQFCDIVKEIWSSYWVIHRGKFVKYPTSVLTCFFDELGHEDYDNIVLVH